ncbi:MAG: asparagine synthase (glutamine-hydrolyzing) [Nanoarchaeota archaeon]|nr:asparagine synthase (glutamine-hydrolyzing) [Nanoarchaeota archaeon]
MCGITGVLDLKGKSKLSKKIAIDMTKVLKHRGPDDSGIFLDKGIFLGHRRLSIIDLSKNGHQPMSDKEKKIWITFNGEIYNFQEIKNILIQKGYKFFSKSDTETIINAYKEWGISCLERFNGMFAFALWDKNELYLVRDRLGVKPLYYSVFDGKLIFASEIKSILAYPKFKRKPNLKAISSYLSYRYVLGEETLFENINQLLPGHFIKVKDGEIIKKEYWDIKLTLKKKDLGEKYYLKKIQNLVTSATKRRMISDVPLGAYLSGGLDSSVIVAIMSKLKTDRFKTFTVGFQEEGFNEFEYSKKVAEKCDVDHKEILLSCKDYIKTLKKLIKYKDLPLSVPNEVPLYLMSKELKKDITVVLSGEGADEVFGGYGRLFRSPFDYKRLKLREKLPNPIKKSLFKNLNKKYKHKKFSSELDHFLYLYSYFPFEEKKFLFNEEMNKLINNDENLKYIFNRYFNKCPKLSYYDKILYTFEKLHLPGLLGRVDNATMATSVEARPPFVDYELVEFLFSIPFKYKIKWKSLSSRIKSLTKTSDDISENLDITKYLLRKSFSGDLPGIILKRKKQGFPVPLDKWFKTELVAYAQNLLLRKDAKINEIIDQKNLKIWIENNLKFGKDKLFGQKLWMLLNVEFWMEEYF